MIEWTRRRFVGCALAAAASMPVLGGRSAEAENFVPDCLASSGDVPVDVHAHLFNGTDLQVERFLSRVIAPSLPAPLRPVFLLLGPVLQAAAWKTAPNGAAELVKLREFDALRALEPRIAAAAAARLVADHRREGVSRFSNGFAEQLKTPLGQQFIKAYSSYRDSVSQKIRIQAFPLEELKRPDRLAEYLEVERRTRGFDQILNFASRFFQYRYVNAHYLMENFGCKNMAPDTEGPGVFACLMVDFDYPLGAGASPPPTRLDEQIEVMERIAVLSRARVLPFVPFDPWR